MNLINTDNGISFTSSSSVVNEPKKWIPSCPDTSHSDKYTYQEDYQVWTISKKVFQAILTLYPYHLRHLNKRFTCPLCNSTFTTYDNLASHIGMYAAAAFYEHKDHATTFKRVMNADSIHVPFDKGSWALRMGIPDRIGGKPNPIFEAIVHAKDMPWWLWTMDRAALSEYLKTKDGQFYFKNFLRTGYGEQQVAAFLQIIDDDVEVHHEYPTGIHGYNAFDAVALKRDASGNFKKVFIGQGKAVTQMHKPVLFDSLVHDLVAGICRFKRLDGILLQLLADTAIAPFIKDLMKCHTFEKSKTWRPSVKQYGKLWNIGRWGNGWVQFKIVPVEKSDFEDPIHFGAIEPRKPFYRKYKLEFFIIMNNFGDNTFGKPFLSRNIKRFTGFSDPSTGLNITYFTYHRSKWDSNSLNEYIGNTIEALRQGTQNLVSIPIPSGFIAPLADVAALRSNSQIILLNHIRVLYSKGIGFIVTKSIANRIDCSEKTVESVLKSLIKHYHMLRVSKESILSLAARAGHAAQLKVNIPLKLYTLEIVADVTTLVEKTNCIRKKIRKIAEDATNGGMSYWLELAGFEPICRASNDSFYTWRQKKEHFQTSFAEALFEMVMTDPENPAWGRSDSPFES